MSKDTATKSKKLPKANVYTALFTFQGKSIVIPKNSQGKAQNGDTYWYANLDDTITGTKKELQEVGLMITQIGESTDLVTIMMHPESGTSIVSKLPLGTGLSSQDLGARITYLRRYMYNSILGLSNEDVDGNGKNAPKIDIMFGADVGKPMTSEPVMLPPNTKAGMVLTEPETRSLAFIKAWNAVQSADSQSAIGLLMGQIEKSIKLSPSEKAELLEILKSKVTMTK